MLQPVRPPVVGGAFCGLLVFVSCMAAPVRGPILDELAGKAAASDPWALESAAAILPLAYSHVVARVAALASAVVCVSRG